MRFVFVLIAALVPVVSAQTIEGKVTNSVTGAPLNGVAVTIQAGFGSVYQTTTDYGGAFRIDGINPGTYTPKFTKSEFLDLEADSPSLRPVRVAAGSDPVRIEVQLRPMGKILGRVLDGNGDPLSGAEVLLDNVRFGRQSSSDKNGSFSFQVPPGRYTLLAKPPSGLKPPEAGEEEHLGWVPTYYPGVIDPHAAVSIVLNPGSESWGNDIRVKSTILRRVRGVVLNPAGNPMPGVGVRTSRTDETLFEDIETASGADGSFEFPALYDGEWSIFVEKENEGVKLKASTAVQVGSRDLEGIELRLAAPFIVTGKISFDEVGRSDGVKVFLTPDAVAGSQGLAQAVVEKDGFFKVNNVYPGSYKIFASSTDATYFLSSVKVGDREILGQFLNFSPGSAPISISFESKGGGVRGKVEDCGAATVVLVPQDRSLREAQFLKTAKCGDGGRFEIGNLRPGDYYGFAFSRWDGPLDLPPRLDQDYMNSAVSVHVKQGDTATVTLGMTPREP